MNSPGPIPGPVTARIKLPDQSAVRLESVSSRAGSTSELNEIDLSIPRNVCYGLVGHPGSGIDAIAQIIATQRRPKSGSVHVLGIDAIEEPDEVRRRLGYLSHPHAVPSHLRVDEYLSLRASAYGVPIAQHGAISETLLTLVGLAGRQDAMTNDLSPAGLQLLAVAGTLVHDPTVVVLEEPAAGLDGRDNARLWNMLNRLVDVSRTVIVCSRSLSEIAAGCAQVAILDDGRVVDHGTPADVTARLGGARRIRARLSNGAMRTHTVADDAAQAALLRKLIEGGVDLLEFSEVAPELDDLDLGGKPIGPRGIDGSVRT